MTDQLIIALAQINPTVGDLSGNVERIRAAAKEATKGDADLVVEEFRCHPPVGKGARSSYRRHVPGDGLGHVPNAFFLSFHLSMILLLILNKLQYQQVFLLLDHFIYYRHQLNIH